MRKTAILTAITLVLMLAPAFAVWSVDVNGGYDSQSATAIDETEDGVQCVPDDGNYTIKITDANAGTGLHIYYLDNSGNSYATQVGVVSDGNGYFDEGDTNIHVGGAPAGTNADLTVAAPTTEGIRYLCVADANAPTNSDRIDCELVGVKPDSTYTEFTITNSDGNGFCKTTTYSSFQGKIVDNAGNGQIETIGTQTWNMSGDLGLDAGIDWERNRLSVSLSAIEGTHARITFSNPNIPSGQYQVRRNQSGCSICGNKKNNNGEITFDVTDFSEYEIVDTPTGVVGEDGVTSYTPGISLPTVDISGIADAVGGTNNLVLIGIVATVLGVIVLASKKK